jgi:hypothetical protein
MENHDWQDTAVINMHIAVNRGMNIKTANIFNKNGHHSTFTLMNIT